jgi:hypothetical protein
VAKDIRATERIVATSIIQFSNLLNHFQPANPSLNIDSPANLGSGSQPGHQCQRCAGAADGVRPADSG